MAAVCSPVAACRLELSLLPLPGALRGRVCGTCQPPAATQTTLVVPAPPPALLLLLPPCRRTSGFFEFHGNSCAYSLAQGNWTDVFQTVRWVIVWWVGGRVAQLTEGGSRQLLAPGQLDGCGPSCEVGGSAGE